MIERKPLPTQDESRSLQRPVCPYCQRRFQTQDDLTLHIVTRHTQTGKSGGLAQAGKR